LTKKNELSKVFLPSYRRIDLAMGYPSSYRVHSISRNEGDLSFLGGMAWEEEPWAKAETLRVSHFHPKSSSAHPETRCKVLYDEEGLFGSFKVEDRYVIGRYTEPQSPVCRDSCVEFFVKPERSSGYFNFEISCIGTLFLLYITDPQRTQDGFREATPVSVKDGLKIWTSIRDRPLLPERLGPLEWRVDFFIPFSLFAAAIPHFASPREGHEWRGNFYKCADDSSHPHWAAWAPIGEELNFHVPSYFGHLLFL